jgi:ApeA N-terminal domain 1
LEGEAGHLRPGILPLSRNAPRPEAFTENRFINLIWGIESFHRVKHPKHTTSIKIEEKIARLLEATPAKDKKWLAHQLKNAAEPSLELRILETIKSLPLGLEERRCRQFAKSCADRRNDLSHYGGQRKGGRYDEFARDLAYKGEALAFLSHMLILQELELDESIVNGYVHKSSKSYRIKSALVEVGLLDNEVLKPTPRPPKPS